MFNLILLSLFFSIFSLSRPIVYISLILFISVVDTSYLNLIGYSTISAAVGLSAIAGCIYKIFSDKFENLSVNVFLFCLVFYIYGIFRALNESLYVIDIIFASGNFISIFIFPYLLFFSNQVATKKLINIVILFSALISLFVLLAILGLNILNLPLRSSFISLVGVQVPFVTLLGLGFILVLNDEKIKYRSGLLLLLTIGIFMQGHSSVTICVMLAFVARYLHLLNLYRMFSTTFLNFVAFSSFFLLMINISEIHSFLSLYFEGFQARDNQNLFRINALERNDFGMGFIPSNTDIQQRIFSYSLSAFDRNLFTIDGGYINLGLIFGPYISAIYLFLIHYIISYEINSNTQKDFLIIYLLTLFVVNFSLSVHSYLFGFLTIAIGLLVLKNHNQKHEN